MRMFGNVSIDQRLLQAPHSPGRLFGVDEEEELLISSFGRAHLFNDYLLVEDHSIFLPKKPPSVLQVSEQVAF